LGESGISEGTDEGGKDNSGRIGGYC
jgi:hypothetical protein